MLPEIKGGTTHMHAMLMIKMRAIFELRLMFRSLIRRTGSKAMLKSQMAKMADIKYVNATMVFMLIQVPVSPRARVQKYSTGLHWKVANRP